MDTDTKSLLQQIASNTKSAGFNVGGSVVDLICTSLAFVLSLALNDALSKSFSVVIKKPEEDKQEAPVSGAEIGGAWIYAAVMLVVIIFLIYLLNSCTRPSLVKITKDWGCFRNKKKK